MKERLAELVATLKENYTPDLSNIANYDMTDVSRFLPLMIIGLCIGVFVASCIYYYHSQYLGSVVRALYKSGAFSEESALSLADVNCDKWLIRKALGRENLLSRYVKKADKGYYIPENEKYIAEKRFKAVRGGLWTLLLIFIICLFGCFSLLLTVPQVMQLADNAVTMIKS